MFFFTKDFLTFFYRYNVVNCFNFSVWVCSMLTFIHQLYFNIFYLTFFLNQNNVQAGVAYFYTKLILSFVKFSNFFINNKMPHQLISRSILKKEFFLFLKHNEFSL